MKTITPQIRRAPVASTPPPLPSGRATVSVALHIDALVFHGFSRSEGQRAAVALQHELTRLVTAHGLPEFSHEPRAQLDAGTIRASAVRPEMTGTRAARAIHGGLRA